jgi:hypothetical protein
MWMNINHTHLPSTHMKVVRKNYFIRCGCDYNGFAYFIYIYIKVILHFINTDGHKYYKYIFHPYIHTPNS